MKEKEFMETYLGDGLYASFDGFQVILRAPRLEGDHFVALESTTWKALLDYMRENVTTWPKS